MTSSIKKDLAQGKIVPSLPGLKKRVTLAGYLSTYRDVAPVAALGGLITVGAFHSVVE